MKLFVSFYLSFESYDLAAEPKKLIELDSDHDYRYRPEIITEVEREIAEFLRVT